MNWKREEREREREREKERETERPERVNNNDNNDNSFLYSAYSSSLKVLSEVLTRGKKRRKFMRGNQSEME